VERGIEQYLIVFVIMFVALADLLLGWLKRRMGKGGSAERESPPVFVEDDEAEREFLARIERELVLKKQQEERALAAEQRAHEERIQAQRAEGQQVRDERMLAQRNEEQQARDERRLQRPREAATRTVQLPDVLQRPDPLVRIPRTSAMSTRGRSSVRGGRPDGWLSMVRGGRRGGTAFVGSKDDLRRAIVLREVLGPPRGLE
jgi:hypothetical protein